MHTTLENTPQEVKIEVKLDRNSGYQQKGITKTKHMMTMILLIKEILVPQICKGKKITILAIQLLKNHQIGITLDTRNIQP